MICSEFSSARNTSVYEEVLSSRLIRERCDEREASKGNNPQPLHLLFSEQVSEQAPLAPGCKGWATSCYSRVRFSAITKD